MLKAKKQAWRGVLITLGVMLAATAPMAAYGAPLEKAIPRCGPALHGTAVSPLPGTTIVRIRVSMAPETRAHMQENERMRIVTQGGVVMSPVIAKCLGRRLSVHRWIAGLEVRKFEVKRLIRLSLNQPLILESVSGVYLRNM